MSTEQISSGSIVVAVDGSEHAQRALRWAGVVAAREHRTLTLVHAAESPDPGWMAFPAVPAMDMEELKKSTLEAGHQLLDQAAEQVRSEHSAVEVRTHCEIGDPREVFVALSPRAHLLVIGSHGRGAVRRLLLGSVATAITRHAECPVVVIRGLGDQAGGHGVLVGIDGTERSTETLEFAFRAASWLQVPLTVLHCFWDISRREQDDSLVGEGEPGYDEERALMSESLAGLRDRYPDVEVRAQLARGLVDRIMVDLARGSDLLVVGARSHGAIREALLGSVATTMLEYAPCPVAVIPRGHAAQ